MEKMGHGCGWGKGKRKRYIRLQYVLAIPKISSTSSKMTHCARPVPSPSAFLKSLILMFTCLAAQKKAIHISRKIILTTWAGENKKRPRENLCCQEAGLQIGLINFWSFTLNKYIQLKGKC